MPSKCRLCDLYKERLDFVCETDLFYAALDKSPVTPGHTIIFPKRHAVSLFDLKTVEWTDLQVAIKKTVKTISIRRQPDGYNFGVNEGLAAGRTIDHLHMHVIPRYIGDTTAPQGGVRNLI